MTRRVLNPLLLVVIILLFLTETRAQTATYHLHNEASTDLVNVLQLKTAGPDRSSLALTTIDLKQVGIGEYFIKTFETEAGIPGVSGIIPSGSNVSFTMWMRKTANNGTMFPRAKLFLDTSVPGAGSSVLICVGTGGTALTTTLTQYTFTCNTSSAIQVASSNRYTSSSVSI